MSFTPAADWIAAERRRYPDFDRFFGSLNDNDRRTLLWAIIGSLKFGQLEGIQRLSEIISDDRSNRSPIRDQWRVSGD